ncbi:MAG: hypothetical protein HFE70_04750 [Enterobacter sp.]|uniref:hypothetical protein n=1 Tax=Enterobacter sp. TaxID=42895 RepID=UPI000BA85622|nr:hypothetical protein [Enterobacter sp.]MCI8903507.1 hypothetical protein [Enterobacter sp.]PAO07141.1 hypothetical protein CIW61_06350 [Enterobacter cloacae]
MTKIIERGMIFNGEMVRAILDGRKTQTRRVIKDCTVGRDQISKFIQIGKKFIGCYPEDVPELIRECCPYGVPGDRIWVRETFCSVPHHEEPAGCSALLYAADGNGPYGKWTPSIHMPRWASRILLEITDVRVERLNDISEEDARSEGISGSSARDIKEAYAALWRSIYGSDSWQANPWVWVIVFKRIEGDDHATD